MCLPIFETERRHKGPRGVCPAALKIKNEYSFCRIMPSSGSCRVDSATESGAGVSASFYSA
jgi:hypothetical protein